MTSNPEMPHGDDYESRRTIFDFDPEEGESGPNWDRINAERAARHAERAEQNSTTSPHDEQRRRREKGLLAAAINKLKGLFH